MSALGASGDAPLKMGLAAIPPEGSGAGGALVVHDLVKTYRPKGGGRKGVVVAVDHVSFRLEPGAAVALVGASGSGKSTLARLITAMERPTEGEIYLDDVRVDTLGRRGVHRHWGLVQMVFQDPYAALNPAHTVAYALSRPLVNHRGLGGRDLERELHSLLELVELTPAARYATKLPHQLSGGQRQRVVIARALAAGPKVIVADEPVSMLDVSLRAGILRLLGNLRKEKNVSLFYITHDLLSARVVTQDVMVMSQGCIVEAGPTADVLRHPTHPYTKALLAAVPAARNRRPAGGEARPSDGVGPYGGGDREP